MTSLPPLAQQGLELVTTNLQNGPFGPLALSLVTWSVVLPLTVYRKLYGISVAYGFSVFWAAFVLSQIFGATGNCLAQAVMFYGFRLGGFLLVRDISRKQLSASTKNGSLGSRVNFSASLAVFYALLVTPLLQALRNPVASDIYRGGAYLAWAGAVLEAWGDGQKLWVKRQHKGSDENVFVGPTRFAYSVSRHPNYLGEVMFWTGVFISGAPSFGRSISAWLCSSLGLFGIISIMTKATEGLEKRQSEKYTGQEKYDGWKANVKYSLVPFLK